MTRIIAVAVNSNFPSLADIAATLGHEHRQWTDEQWKRGETVPALQSGLDTRGGKVTTEDRT